MKLVTPSVVYKDSFIKAVIEYEAENTEGKHFRNRHYNSLNVEKLRQTFASYIESEHDKAKGLHLPKGHVPESNYWLVDGNEFIGRISIRHFLTENLKHIGHIGYDIRPSKRGKGYGRKILELSLPLAKRLGIEKVSIGCFAANIPSRKVIEANGGVLEETIPSENGESDKLLYRIQLD